MGAIADFWKSERGLLAVLLVIGATVLTGLGSMTVDQWLDYTKWIFGLYAGSKTVTGAVDLLTAAKRSAPATATTETVTATPVPAPNPVEPALTPAEPSA
jgi:hypothetical protein